PGPLLTVPDVLRRNHGRRPGAAAVVADGHRLDHGQLAERAWSVANGLRNLGVRPGDTVAILCGNGIFSAETILGAITAGAIAAPLNWRWSPAALALGLTDSQARIVLTDAGFAPQVNNLVQSGQTAGVTRVFVGGGTYA